MRHDNNIVLDHIARKMSVIENALQQVIEMQSLFYMEIELLKKQIDNPKNIVDNENNNDMNSNNNSNNNLNNNSNNNSNNDGDLDIAAVQRILRSQQISSDSKSSSQIGKRL